MVDSINNDSASRSMTTWMADGDVCPSAMIGASVGDLCENNFFHSPGEDECRGTSARGGQRDLVYTFPSSI